MQATCLWGLYEEMNGTKEEEATNRPGDHLDSDAQKPYDIT